MGEESERRCKLTDMQVQELRRLARLPFDYSVSRCAPPVTDERRRSTTAPHPCVHRAQSRTLISLSLPPMATLVKELDSNPKNTLSPSCLVRVPGEQEIFF